MFSWIFLRRGWLSVGIASRSDRVDRGDDERPVKDLHSLVIRRVQSASV